MRDLNPAGMPLGPDTVHSYGLPVSNQQKQHTHVASASFLLPVSCGRPSLCTRLHPRFLLWTLERMLVLTGTHDRQRAGACLMKGLHAGLDSCVSLCFGVGGGGVQTLTSWWE